MNTKGFGLRNILFYILVIVLAVTTLCGCNESDDPLTRVEERFAKYGNTENAHEKIIEIMLKLDTDALIEEMNAVMEAGWEGGSLIIHSSVLSEKSPEIDFSYLIGEITNKDNHPWTRKVILEAYERKQENEDTYDDGIPILMNLILDESEDYIVRSYAIYGLPGSSTEVLDFLEKHNHKLGDEIQVSLENALDNAYFYHLTEDEADKTISSYMDSEIIKLNASIDKKSRILKSNENALSEDELLRAKEEFIDICIEIFENYPLFEGENFAYGGHPSNEAAYALAYIGHERAVEYIKKELPKKYRLPYLDDNTVRRIAIDSLLTQ